jgi:hypothetical protein
MSNNRTLIGVVAGVLVLCLCLVCVGVVLGVYFFQGPTLGSTTGEFRGHYTSGFEVASFVPCSDSQIGNDAGPWWMGSTAESGFYDQYLDVIGGPSAPEYVTVFVVWRGAVSPPGEYGHLGAYTREATVQEVIEMSLDGAC